MQAVAERVVKRCGFGAWQVQMVWWAGHSAEGAVAGNVVTGIKIKIKIIIIIVCGSVRQCTAGDARQCKGRGCRQCKGRASRSGRCKEMAGKRTEGGTLAMLHL